MAKKGARRRPRMTSKGKMILQLSTFVIGSGIYFSDHVLVLIGVFLVLLVVASFLICWRNFKKIQLHREVPESVFAGSEFYVYLSARVESSTNIHCMSIKDYFLPEKKSNFLLPVVNDQWRKIASVKMKIPKRGFYKTAAFKLSSDFPLGFFKIEKKLSATVGMTVFPEPLQNHDGFVLMHGQDNEVEREFCTGRYSYGSFRGLREFVPGDPLKLVSWSVSARSEQLMVRDLEPPEPERYTVVFHAVKIKSVMPDSKQFERCLRLLSGLFVFLQENNISFEFYSSMNNWVPFICDNPAEPPIAALTVLAQAKFGDPDSLSEMNTIIEHIPADYHSIVLGATKLSAWRNKIPEVSGSLTLMDSKHSENINGGHQ
jgi:uncharacterized protein (DUF58 family)